METKVIKDACLKDEPHAMLFQNTLNAYVGKL